MLPRPDSGGVLETFGTDCLIAMDWSHSRQEQRCKKEERRKSGAGIPELAGS